MEFRVLGPLEVIDDEGVPVAVTGAKERAILAALLLRIGEVVAADRLIEILWPDSLPTNPGNALQARVSALRRSLRRAGVVVTRSPGYLLAAAPDRVDAHRFERLVVSARAETDHLHAVAAYDDALAMWRGDAYAEFLYEDFARGEIARLDELRVEAIEERAARMVEAGLHAEALGDLERLVLEHPLRERPWGTLMLARYRSGRQAEALRAYREATRVLGEELGIEPSEELRRLEEAILLQDPALAAPEVEGPPQGNLPARVASVVGRSEDIARITTILGEHRMITLTGPGGVGKTTLAIAAAEHGRSDFPDGAWIVELGALSAGADVGGSIARTLGLPVGDRPAVEMIGDAIRSRRSLLILDNCEHLIQEAATTAASVLARAPAVRMIATSREPLNVPGEILWPTRPLPVPDEVATPAGTDDQGIDAVASVRLFVERARAARPDFAFDADSAPFVARICRRLDGLPLAIELAAARLQTLAVADVAARLDRDFGVLGAGPRTHLPRQQTLEATIAWSHDLLTEAEQDLFRQLSVFSGGWDLEAVEAISDDPAAPELLSALAERSLVTVDHAGGTARFAMLETIRDFAARQLDGTGSREDVEARHVSWFLRLSERADFRGPDQPRWVQRLSRDHDNLVAAVQTALHRGDTESAARLGAAGVWVWFFGDRDEGRRVLNRIITASSGGAGADRIGVLLARAFLDFFDGGDDAIAAAEEAMILADRAGDRHGAALARVFAASTGLGGPIDRPLALIDEALDLAPEGEENWVRALAHFQRMEVRAHGGDLNGAVPDGETAMQIFRSVGDPWGVSAALAHVGRYGRATGQVARALEVLEEAELMARAGGLGHTLQFVLTDLGLLAAAAGDHDTALTIYDEAARVAEEAGNPIGAATVANAQAESMLERGDREAARSLHEWALERFQRLGIDAGVAHTLSRLGLVAEVEGDWDRAQDLHHRSAAMMAPAGRAIESVPPIEGLGRVAAACGNFDRAAVLLGAASMLRHRTGLVARPPEATANAATALRLAAADGVDPATAAESLAEATTQELLDLHA